MRKAAFWLLVLVMAGCKPQPEPKAADRPVVLHELSYAEDRAERSYAGEVRSAWEVGLGFRISGKLIERRVELGDRAVAGTVLARLDPKDLELQMEAARAQRAAAQTESDTAAAELERHRELLARGLIGQAVYDQKQTADAAAKARLDQAMAHYEVVSNQAGYAELIATRDGVITEVQAEVGQVVSAGQTVFRMSDPVALQVFIDVPEGQIGEFAAGQPLEVALWSAPGLRIPAHVAEIAAAADATTRTYRVKLNLEDAKESAQLGMSAIVFRRLEQPVALARIPLPALIDRNGEPAVMVYDPASGTVNKVAVVVVGYSEDSAILQGPLAGGTQIVRGGAHLLADGQKVTVAQPLVAR